MKWRHGKKEIRKTHVSSKIYWKHSEEKEEGNPSEAVTGTAVDGAGQAARQIQRQNIKRYYAKMKSQGKYQTLSEKVRSILEDSFSNIANYTANHGAMILSILCAGMVLLAILGLCSSCAASFPGGAGTILGTSYTAEDSDIIQTNKDYCDLETELQRKISNIEQTHSGYDEYRYDLQEISHNPYELTAYLTVCFEDYERQEVQQALQELFDRQYQLTLREQIEIRYREEVRTGYRTVTDPVTGMITTEEYEYTVDVPYEYRILIVSLKSKPLETVIRNSGLTADQLERYEVLMETKGNRAYLFRQDIYSNPGEYLEYDIPGEALTDSEFAALIREAEKYLGMEYVWGGSTPQTGFDCSGYICHVLNQTGTDVGRTTANGLMRKCRIISPSEAKPGDLIFFQGTYNVYGASHVGIYVGNHMMIHCGNPISYASIDTPYWRQHFYCFGRI